MIHEILCIFHVLENGFMYVSVCINTWYIHDTYMKIHVDRKCLVAERSQVARRRLRPLRHQSGLRVQRVSRFSQHSQEANLLHVRIVTHSSKQIGWHWEWFPLIAGLYGQSPRRAPRAFRCESRQAGQVADDRHWRRRAPYGLLNCEFR